MPLLDFEDNKHLPFPIMDNVTVSSGYAKGNDASPSLSLKGIDFRPNFRKGAICDILDKMTPYQIDQVEDSISNREYWEKTLDIFKNYPSLFRCKYIEPGKGKTKIEYREGPIIKFPTFKTLLHKDVWVEVRCSNTICSRPNHSKIWIGISYEKIENSREDITIDRFFYNANYMANNMASVLIKNYENALKNLKITRRSLDNPYYINIQTMMEDLTTITPKLKSKSFSFLRDFDIATQHKAITWILNKSYEKKPLSKEEYSHSFKSANQEWVVFNTYGNPNLTGIYFRNYKKRQTDFKGVVHKPAISKQKTMEATKNFSTALIRNLGPWI